MTNKIAYYILGIYVCVAVIWSLVFNLLPLQAINPSLNQVFKDVFFVSISGVMILVIALWQKGKIEEARKENDNLIEELVANIEAVSQELKSSYLTTLEGWAKALELRDQETSGHSHRVVAMTKYLAIECGFSDEELENICYGALMHDIGKIGVPDAILLKPSFLTSEERSVMERHPVYAKDWLENTPFKDALSIPFLHHEHWDGSGYPVGLKGKFIPLEARIFALVDTADAMGSDRPYHKAFTINEIYTFLIEQKGKLFDPEMVDLFIKEDILRKRDLVGNYYIENAGEKWEN